MTFRVSEIYPSVQGEGPRTGETTIFLRFGGCNLRCPGWPCDTQHAIDPKYRHEWLKQEPENVYDAVIARARSVGAKMITYTGGEPFLQRSGDLHWLTMKLRSIGYTVECFSNGTLEYPGWATEFIHFIMDWKMPGSGEDPHNKARLDNLVALRSKDAVKFVCNDMEDLQFAHDMWLKHIENKSSVQVYYGKVWNSSFWDEDLVEYVMLHQLPWKLNVQLHNYIWDPQERGR